ncbi:2,3-diphosphoglycerate-dependent phosphoglycerate mutase [Candidatus Marinimicrobia bacterium]|nr:2,3-diphosphoglycerate-dependent phosphoglycerate mutase [Candidatus Neomarinimicrobiota bacterium]MDA9735730.1 2,3-diphosphoglycerate-dependent phosphoglycerate mutase [Candidatus Neomarinimicrobiota bacterium]
MKKIILLRHGQSQWNLENRFTGWKNVSLTKTGIEEATFSGHQLVKSNIKIKSVNTSILDRAIETTRIVTDIINFPKEKIHYDWRLNERHYGALQGLNKSETALKYGEDQVHIWRRSYDIAPPLLLENDDRHPKLNKKFKDIGKDLPIGESLKNVIDRLKPFWKEYVNNFVTSGDNHLIVAHSNSLRAIVKILDQLSSEEIVSVNIPTGVPLVYTLDKSLNVLDKKYLIDKEELKAKQEIVVNQGKAK